MIKPAALLSGLFLLALLALVACGSRGSSPTVATTATPSPAIPKATSAPTPGPTPASSSGPVRFAVKGDWGAASSAQASVTTRMCEWRQTTGFTYVLTTGDNFYTPDGTATDGNYYIPEKCLYADPRHQWRAAWGNHDYSGSSTEDVLGSPSQAKYFSWTAGDVAFFAYDGSDVSQVQGEWLRSAVCSSKAAVKIIYGHQPPYSTGPHGSSLSVRDMVHPAATDCGARLVLSGHDHLYERSVPIEGVTYIVTGGGGAGTYACGTSQAWAATCLSRHHFLHIEVDSTAIHIQAVGTNGEVFDAVDIQS